MSDLFFFISICSFFLFKYSLSSKLTNLDASFFFFMMSHLLCWIFVSYSTELPNSMMSFYHQNFVFIGLCKKMTFHLPGEAHNFFYVEFLFLVSRSWRIPQCHSITRISFSLDFVKRWLFISLAKLTTVFWISIFLAVKNILTASTNRMSFLCLGHDLCSFQFIQYCF